MNSDTISIEELVKEEPKQTEERIAITVANALYESYKYPYKFFDSIIGPMKDKIAYAGIHTYLCAIWHERLVMGTKKSILRREYTLAEIIEIAEKVREIMPEYEKAIKMLVCLDLEIYD